jgi:hypothetical protein
MNGQPMIRARLHLYLDDRSSASDPWVQYTIYQEHALTRLWSFQVNGARPGEFVIYINESGEWWLPEKWKFYDLSDKFPAWRETIAYESVIVPSASQVYVSRLELARCCLARLFCHLCH